MDDESPYFSKQNEPRINRNIYNVSNIAQSSDIHAENIPETSGSAPVSEIAQHDNNQYNETVDEYGHPYDPHHVSLMPEAQIIEYPQVDTFVAPNNNESISTGAGRRQPIEQLDMFSDKFKAHTSFNNRYFFNVNDLYTMSQVCSVNVSQGQLCDTQKLHFLKNIEELDQKALIKSIKIRTLTNNTPSVLYGLMKLNKLPIGQQIIHGSAHDVIDHAEKTKIVDFATFCMHPLTSKDIDPQSNAAECMKDLRGLLNPTKEGYVFIAPIEYYQNIEQEELATIEGAGTTSVRTENTFNQYNNVMGILASHIYNHKLATLKLAQSTSFHKSKETSEDKPAISPLANMYHYTIAIQIDIEYWFIYPRE